MQLLRQRWLVRSILRKLSGHGGGGARARGGGGIVFTSPLLARFPFSGKTKTCNHPLSQFARSWQHQRLRSVRESTASDDSVRGGRSRSSSCLFRIFFFLICFDQRVSRRTEDNNFCLGSSTRLHSAAVTLIGGAVRALFANALPCDLLRWKQTRVDDGRCLIAAFRFVANGSSSLNRLERTDADTSFVDFKPWQVVALDDYILSCSIRTQGFFLCALIVTDFFVPLRGRGWKCSVSGILQGPFRAHRRHVKFHVQVVFLFDPLLPPSSGGAAAADVYHWRIA
mmetsp:Transcript_42457/g.78516  ORF Transcript_42457/g.78516 Transcript_42457/m.78516 type:complete len:283 (+) Transcript_42457:469-1317(+)